VARRNRRADIAFDMIRSVQLLLALTLALSCATARGAPEPDAPFTRGALAPILSLGPWPPAVRKDPGNRVSGDPRAIELGRRLFRDARMSPVGYIACVTCHQPDRSFTDLKARAHGLADLPRNTPALANLRQQRWFGWGGSSDSLWMASIRPMLDPREFDGSSESVTRIFRRDPELAACFRKVFGESPFRDRERTVVSVGKALAAYVETLVTERTPFDELRSALARRDAAAMRAYPAAARRGLELFVGTGGCIDCHNGPNFSDGRFHPGAASSMSVTGIDDGRLAGTRELKKSRFNLLGSHNDDRSRANAVATSRIEPEERMRGQFRTPSLRNVAVTAPYMHDGHVDALRDAIRHAPPRSARDGAATPLTERQVADLEAFLVTLTDRHGERRPWATTSDVRCP
jgi:cytochrome c peroxidase